MNKKVAELSQQIKEIAYELETFGVHKEATPTRLYKYIVDDFVFYSDKRIPNGFRVPTGRAKWTKEYFPVSGTLAKEIRGDEDED